MASFFEVGIDLLFDLPKLTLAFGDGDRLLRTMLLRADSFLLIESSNLLLRPER